MDTQPPACDACRAKKRKCDKAQPVCSQCSIRSCRCVYSRHIVAGKKRKRPPRPAATEPQERGDDGPSGRTPSQDAASSLGSTEFRVPQVAFPASSFIDRAIHSEFRMRVPSPPACSGFQPMPFPVDAANAENRRCVASFISGVQTWLPVFSEDQLYEHAETPRSRLTVDAALLLRCVGLVASSSPCTWSDGPRTDLYVACKRGFGNLEIAGVLSNVGLQAGLLISLYEISHAVYPSAFLSIGACFRYGIAMGLGSRNKFRLRPPLNRSEHEESKRLWWAILLLNRFVALGNPGQDIVGDDPPDDIPIQSTSNSEEMAAANVFTDEPGRTKRQSCFTLLIESTKLLGRVLRQTSSKYADDGPKPDQQLLDRTLKSLISAAEQEANKWGMDVDGQLTICYSSILALHQPGSAAGPGTSRHVIWDQAGRDAIQPIADRIISRCRTILSTPQPNLDSISPFFIHGIYSVAVADAGPHPQRPFAERALMEKTLERLDERWRAAGAYLELLRVRDVMRL